MLGGKHSDTTALSSKTCWLHGGFKAYDRHIGPPLSKIIYSRRSGSITTHNNHLNAFVNKPLNSHLGKAAYLLTLSTSIGTILAIAQIYERLLG
jgi:hypothetical protein